MTPIDIFALACTMIALACGSWALVDARRAARARREAEEAAQQLRASFREAMFRSMISAMGAQLRVFEAVEPDEIRAGDEISFHQTLEGGCIDTSIPSVDYTAGFNGDTGGLTGGLFLRPA